MSNEQRVDRVIDEAIKRRFAPPDLDAVVQHVRAHGQRPRRWWWGWRAAAAAVLILVLVAWWIWLDDGTGPSEPSDGTQAEIVIEEVPISEAGSQLGCGMVNDWSAVAQRPPQAWIPFPVCSTENFASMTKKTLGCVVSVDESCRPTVPVRDKLKPSMLSFTARRGDDVVIVYLVPSAEDAIPTLPASNVRCWRRAVGPVVAYEVSDLPEPFVLPSLTVPQ